MKQRFAVPLLLLFFALLLAWRPAGAQGEPIEPPIWTPEPPSWNVDGLRIAYQRVNVTIEQQVATTRIEQLFVNPNDWMLEGVYLFPLPPGAAVSRLTMWVDGQAIEARILDATEARAIYDEIVRQLRDPALLEYVGAGAIQANVFPIPARAERKIEIEYSHILTADNGLLHYVYAQSGHLYTSAPLESQSIRVEIRAQQEIRAVYSPSHSVAISREDPFRAVAGYEAGNVSPRQDFELYYSVAHEEIGLNVLSYRQPGEDGYFLLLAAPAIDVDPDQIVARDVIVVLDTSGSMQGQKMAQAKDAAHYILSHLNAEDRFNIVAFSTGVRAYAPTLSSAAGAADARSFVDRLEASGGTNISLALLEALQQGDPERPLTVLFLTDGLATEGIVETPLLLDAVAAAAPDSARIFSFGVGDDVDTLLLGSLSENHRGAATYVRTEQAIDEAVSSFYAKVSTPLLSNVTLQVDGVIVEQLYPERITDLFAGSQLIVTGRYRQGGAARVTLSGEVNGELRTFHYDDISFRDDGGDAFIPRLWATRAIGRLLQQIRLNGESEELVRSVVDLSVRYGIITPYTSFLIEEEDIFTQSGRDDLATEAMAPPGAPVEFSGAAAVDQARAAGELAEAEAPAALPTALSTGADAGVDAGTIVAAGAKSFVYRDGVWIDTAYDPGAHTPRQVGFASEVYFELLSAAPELASYLAIGPRVLVVHQGQAYEIVEGEGEATSELPPATDGGDPATPAPQQASPAAPDPAARAMPCAAVLLAPLFLGALALLFALRRP